MALLASLQRGGFLASLPAIFVVVDVVGSVIGWRWNLNSGFIVTIGDRCDADGAHTIYSASLVRKDGFVLNKDSGDACSCGGTPCTRAGYLLREDMPDRVEENPHGRISKLPFELADGHESFPTYYARNGMLSYYGKKLWHAMQGKSSEA